MRHWLVYLLTWLELYRQELRFRRRDKAGLSAHDHRLIAWMKELRGTKPLF